MNGFATILRELVSRQEVEISVEHRKFFMDLLFENLNNIQNMHPRCRQYTTRVTILRLILELSKNYPCVIRSFLDRMRELYLNGKWRTSDSDDWEVSAREPEKQTKYSGLVNLGCICYMNSFLQQLFMIPSFMKDVIKTNDSSAKKLK